jgi:peroxiredoxin
MSLTPTTKVNLGFKAPNFNLTEPLSGKKGTLNAIKGKKGTLIMFICNHCPYVIHIIDGIVALAKDYQNKGITFIAINSNDTDSYADDSPENMIKFSQTHSFTFPYLFDETQEVAMAYDAACTPDFNLIDAEGKVIYRGRFDAARPGNTIVIDGVDMRIALDRLLSGKNQLEEQFSSLGCNIKWK